MDHPAWEAGVTQTITQLGIILFCTDTRNKSLGAGQSEDTADTAGHVNGTHSRIAAATGSTGISTHHFGHGDRSRGRGSSAWGDGVDFGYTIDGTADTFAEGGTMVMKPHKMRDDTRPEPISYRLVRVPDLVADGVEISSAGVEQVGGPTLLSEHDRFLQWLEAKPGAGKNAARAAIGGNHHKADALIQRAINRGDVENRGKSHRWKLFRCDVARDFSRDPLADLVADELPLAEEVCHEPG
jgi:hypothetical protein